MWVVDNRTPFAADRSWARDRDGAEVWLVAVKCTFRVLPNGTTAIAEDQPPVSTMPEYFGDPATSSLRYDTDFVLTKPTTDVLLHGSAYAPNGRPTTVVDVALRVGSVHKTLRVTGDRQLRPDLRGVAPGPPAPFLRLPLGYERSHGGRELRSADPARPRFDERNPVGVGYVPALGHPAPNVEYPRSPARPAGFGPIPPHWKPRSTYAGTYDDAWSKERYPLYPRDLDDRFFLCSPEDQRPPAHLRGGELVELTNLTPEGKLVFGLPRVALGFETVFRDGERVHHPGALYTVLLEPDAQRVSLVWRASLPCHPKVQQLVRTIVWQKEILDRAAREPSPRWSRA